jgi:Rv0078B-related antitoxin
VHVVGHSELFRPAARAVAPGCYIDQRDFQRDDGDMAHLARHDMSRAVLSDTEGGKLSDTSQGAREVYFRRLAEMTPSERLGIGAALWTAGDSLQRAALRRTHPDADAADINFRVAVTRFGAELARKAYRRT